MIKLDHFELSVVIGKYNKPQQLIKYSFILFLKRLVVLQSRPADLSQSSSALTTTPSDLHILMGHENT